MAKTEDWFLRGGKRPPADTKNEDSDDLITCQNCGSDCWLMDVGETCPVCGASLTGGTLTAEYCGADDGEGEATCPMDGEGAPRLFKVTLTREKTVEQTCTVTVRAHDECDALDESRRLIDEGDIDSWDWKDDDDTVEYEYPTPEEAEEAEGTLR